jgi:predicted dehydrogenase
MKWPTLTRRQMLLLSGAGLAATLGYRFSHRPVKLAMVGAGAQGNNLAKALWRARVWGGPWARFVAICDVDQEHARKFQATWSPEAEIYGEHEKVLERDDVEAVLVATPDHWHTRIVYDALKAGKAVYGEKPLGLTVAEGQLLVKTVNETGQVFQGGTFQRSMYEFEVAAELVRSGKLGRVHTVDIKLPLRWTADEPGPFVPQKPPAHLNWERWLGQAPLVGYHPNRCHGYFRRWFEYAGGTVADWGVHYLDIADFALPEFASRPYVVTGKAELPRIKGGFNTPTTFTATLENADGVRISVGPEAEQPQGSIRFEGDRGWVAVSRNRIWGPAVKQHRQRLIRPAVQQFYAAGAPSIHGFMYHLRNFFAAMRGQETPRSDIASMHRASTMCHLINISIRQGGRALRWDSGREVILGDASAYAMLSRAQRSPYQAPPV